MQSIIKLEASLILEINFLDSDISFSNESVSDKEFECNLPFYLYYP